LASENGVVQQPARHRPARRTRVGESRVALGRHRAHRAKVVLAWFGAGVFVVVGVLARVSNAGQARPPVHALAAPPRFVAVVKENLLEAGLVAPAEAPPGAATGTS
jgi:hypothetical protein